MHYLKFNSQEEFESMQSLLPSDCIIDVVGILYEKPVPMEWYHINMIWDLPEELLGKEIFPASPLRTFL